jgi:hypothetical protein
LERFRNDVYRLTQSWQQSRQQETAAAAEQSRALAEQVEHLRAELEQQRGRETEYMQTIAAIQQAIETARVEAAAERERGSNALAEQKAVLRPSCMNSWTALNAALMKTTSS